MVPEIVDRFELRIYRVLSEEKSEASRDEVSSKSDRVIIVTLVLTALHKNQVLT